MKLQRRHIFLFLAAISISLMVFTPVGTRSAEVFWCHMVQHITLMMVSGPLLVLATPSTFHPKGHFFAALTHPVLSWLVYAGVMIGVHLPLLHEFMVNRPWIHTYLEIPVYLIVSYCFYFNLLDRNLVNRRITPAMAVISLFLMMVPETLTGFFIYTAPNSLYNNMFTLNDQRRGGSIMWSGGMVIDAIWIALAVHHWFKAEVRKSTLIDAEVNAEDNAERLLHGL